jgi:hypothetical protein
MAYGSYQTQIPKIIPNCRLWLDAYDPSTITMATGVSSWLDKSGNGFNITQATTTKQPLYTQNLQGGKAGIGFDGIDDNLLGSTTSTLLEPGTGAMSIFTVSRSLSPSGYLVGKGRNNTTTGVAGWASTGGVLGAGRQVSHNIGSSSSVGVESTASIKEFHFTGSTLAYLKNGASIGSKNYTGSVSSGSVLALGGRASNDLYTSGYVHEVLIYKGSLSTEELTIIRGDLSNKWGIAIS